MRRDIRRRNRGVVRFADNIHWFCTIIHLHAGSDGAIYILENGRTVSTNSGTVPIGATLQEIGLAETPEDKSLFTAELDSTECRCYAVNYGKRLILLGIPVSDILDDMFSSRGNSVTACPAVPCS